MRSHVFALGFAVALSTSQSFAQHHRPHSSPPPSGGVQLSGSAAQAQVHYVQGIALYDQDQFEAAIEEFRESVQIYPSPNPQLYVARSLRELGRLLDSQHEYMETVSLANMRASTEPRYAPTRDAAVEELRALEQRLGHLRFDPASIPASAHVVVNQREIARPELDDAISVMPGAVVIDVRSAEFEPVRETVHVTAGNESHVQIQLLASGQPNSLQHSIAFGGFAVGAVGAIGIVTFFLLANSQYQTLSNECGLAPCPSNYRGAIENGRTYQALGDVSIGVAIAGVAAGAALLLTTPSRPRSSVRLGFGGNSILLHGEF